MFPMAAAVHAEIILLSLAHLLRLHNIVILGLNINCIISWSHKQQMTVSKRQLIRCLIIFSGCRYYRY